MPMYSYQCNFCNHSEDMIVKFDDKELQECSRCLNHSMERQITPSNIRPEGGVTRIFHRN